MAKRCYKIRLPSFHLRTQACSAWQQHPPHKKIKGAVRFKKLETRVRHVLVQLEELRSHEFVWNADLPEALPTLRSSLRADPQKLLKHLEVSLRGFLQGELSRVSSNWWAERIPGEVRTRAEKRKERREIVWPWYPSASGSPVDYLDFSDYRKIILEPANWDQVFRHHFRNEAFVETRLGELEPVRHDTAHSRAVSVVARDKLRIYADELTTCMRRRR